MSFNDPARLLDCPFCDGTYWPEETHCSFCKRQVVSDNQIKKMDEMEEHFANEMVKLRDEAQEMVEKDGSN